MIFPGFLVYRIQETGLFLGVVSAVILILDRAGQNVGNVVGWFVTFSSSFSFYYEFFTEDLAKFHEIEKFRENTLIGQQGIS